MIFASILTSTQQLHIPDGFLHNVVSAVCWIVAAVVIAIAVRKAQAKFDERLVPLAGIMAAFIFAAQMINFPVAGGTSGHMVGAALAFIVLGPWLGMLVMSAVIILQALLFQDGGLVVMGANLIVMGIVPGFIGYQIYQFAVGQTQRIKLGVAAGAAWVSIMAAALVTALLLAFSGTISAAIAIPAMLGIHALIGIGEALITTAVLTFIMNSRPTLLEQGAADNGKGNWAVIGLVLALIVVLFAPLASGSPDGLEWVAEQTGFIETAQDAPFELLPDYTIPALGETGMSTIVAGLIGALLVGGIAFGVSRLLMRRPQSTQQSTQ